MIIKAPDYNLFQKIFYYIRLYIFYLKIYVKVMTSYPAGTWIAIIASISAQITAIIFINVLFSKIPVFYNWQYYDILFLFGVATMGRALVQVFLDMPYYLSSFIVRGSLDICMIRPASPLFQTIGMTQEINAIGTLATGIFILIYAGPHTSIDWNIFKFFYLLLALASSMIIQFSYLLAAVVPSFWVMDNRSLLYPLGWLTDFLRYPIDAFHPVLRFILTFIIPYAIGSYYPVLFLINPVKYSWALWGVPLTAAICLTSALFIWKYGIKHYSSAG